MTKIDERLIPEDNRYLIWETDNTFISSKMYGLHNILTGRKYCGSDENIAVLQGGIYLLELMKLNFGGYKYGEISSLSSGEVKSCDLESDLKSFKGISFATLSEDYLLFHSSEYTQETLGKLILELRNAKHCEYSTGEYLCVMMNIHYQTSKGYKLPKALDIIEHNTPYIDRDSNVKAHGSLCRFIQK